MKKISKYTHLVPLFLLWATLSVIFWGWIFSILTDTDPEKKLTLFADCEIKDQTSLALLLEKDTNENIKMAKVHPFSYAMMDSSDIRNADIYIAREDFLNEYADWICPLPMDIFADYPALEKDGTAYGLPVYDAETKTGALTQYLAYEKDGTDAQNYYLFLSASSLHVLTNENACDNVAAEAVLRILSPFYSSENKLDREVSS